jgi:hypothetical protein
MAIFPLAAALVALAFAALVAKDFVARPRSYLAAWAVALLMFAAASFAAFLGVLSGWNSTEFRVYWLLGAILNVPYLAFGELLLLTRDRRVQVVLFLVVVFGTAFALNVVRTADVGATSLHVRDLPLGRDVFELPHIPENPPPHDPAYRLAQYYSYPAYVILVVGPAHAQGSTSEEPVPGNTRHRRRRDDRRDRLRRWRRARRRAGVLGRAHAGDRGDVLGVPPGIAPGHGGAAPISIRRFSHSPDPIAGRPRTMRAAGIGDETATRGR